jgi:hypothetical protein
MARSWLRWSRVVLPALLEGQVHVEHGRAAQLLLEVEPGRVRPVAGIDPDRIAITAVLGRVGAAAGQVNSAEERNAADGPVRHVDH